MNEQRFAFRSGLPLWAGVFLVSMATLAFEILLTRIFSVTMWYHFAFLAISAAMFGMTGGSLFVFLRPAAYPADRVFHQLAASAAAFSISLAVSLFTVLAIPLFTRALPWMATFSYLAGAVPFFFSGICICLALTRFPNDLGSVYASDLAGAAAGCLGVVALLTLMDGPTAILSLAVLAGIASLLFARTIESRRVVRFAGFLSAGVLFVVILNVVYSQFTDVSFLRIRFAKGTHQPRPLYEKWNTYSRVRIIPDHDTRPFGWGFSSSYTPQSGADQLQLDIDSSAATVLTRQSTDQVEASYLQNDVTNLVHYLRKDADVFVIGAGGGRDVLSALVFEQKSVTAVEMNRDILRILTGRFGEFTGHLEKRPGVTLIQDEARSYLARQNQKFDIIQASLIDTWAATAAGAFAFSENALYTQEAWKTFFDHLKPDGLLSFSRWHRSSSPYETFKLAALARRSLRNAGLEHTPQCIAIVTNLSEAEIREDKLGVATVLVGTRPFTLQERARIAKVADNLRFTILFNGADSPGDASLKGILTGKRLNPLRESIAPPTDDRPFFFTAFRLGLFLSPDFWKQGFTRSEQNPPFILGVLLLLVLTLTSSCFLLPVILRARRQSWAGTLPYLIYFAAIGFGFMLIEISQMQRFVLFLGHPTNSLTVVLFGILLASGTGSYVTGRVHLPADFGTAIRWLLGLMAILTLFAVATVPILRSFQAATSYVRILISLSILLSIGFFMGMPLPLGMKTAGIRFTDTTPWFWAINGASSVTASVVAVVLAIANGISSAYWTGVFFYLVAFVAFLAMARSRKQTA